MSVASAGHRPRVLVIGGGLQHVRKARELGATAAEAVAHGKRLAASVHVRTEPVA